MRKFKRVLLLMVTLLLIMSLLAGCASDEDFALGDNMTEKAKESADNQERLERVHPVPEMDWSNNRANIVKKLDTFGSDPNKVSWIYCFLPAGQLVKFSSVKGCVTNLSAYAVPDDNIVNHRLAGSWYSSVVQAPDADGTYGSNGEGIYWYDTAGIYHEWNGFYMLMDQPMKLNVEPLITMEVEKR